MSKTTIRVLLVEDKKFMRDVVKGYIENTTREVNGKEFNIEVFEVEDGEEAVLTYAKDKHEIIIMDLTLDKMDGITATKEILEMNPHAKIIGMASEGDKNVDDFKICGINTFLEKPFQSTYINSRIDSMIEEILYITTIEEIENSQKKKTLLNKLFSK